MITLLICLNVALLVFGVYMIIFWEENFKKLAEYRKQTLIILEKIEELKKRLDSHNL